LLRREEDYRLTPCPLYQSSELLQSEVAASENWKCGPRKTSPEKQALSERKKKPLKGKKKEGLFLASK
jgi:hypothetical protein